jgi:hypothetical protein
MNRQAAPQQIKSGGARRGPGAETSGKQTATLLP